MISIIKNAEEEADRTLKNIKASGAELRSGFREASLTGPGWFLFLLRTLTELQ